MHTIHTSTDVYTYDELAPAAQGKARDWYRQASDGDTFWSESVIDDAVRMAAVLGIETSADRIYWSGFASQGDGASFIGRYTFKSDATAAIRQEAPTDTALHSIADSLHVIQDRYQAISLDCTIERIDHHYSHNRTVRIEMDHDLPDEVESTVVDAMRDLMTWIYRQLQAEYNYQTADDTVAENIRANEYEFTIDGERF